jgi:glyoxylase-like metal-dependent hydrolase (beta-lactamase superfamily II)/ferredoxin
MREERENEDYGRLFVTARCCGAATCRNFAPELLGEVTAAGEIRSGRRLAVLPGTYEEGAFTGVLQQPRSKEELIAARTAMAACPLGAIKLQPGASQVRRDVLGSPWKGYPRPIEDNVWVLGPPSRDNIGATTYFIEREGGGVLIDPPRPGDGLFRWLADHGGVRWLFLTHRDHAHHHAEIASRFPGCQRIIGAADVNLRKHSYLATTGDVEIKLGDALRPFTLEGEPLSEAEAGQAELVVLPQPGHTPGSICLLYRGRFLFTGDHLGYSRVLGHIMAYRVQCWEDWERQTRSVRYLAAAAEAGWLHFTWILPGHGEWQRLPGGGAAETAATLRCTVAWMERQPNGHMPTLNWFLFIMSRLRPRGALGRLLRAIGGGSDLWVLPREVWDSLPAHDPRRLRAAVRRVHVLGAVVLAIAALIIWLIGGWWT